MIAAHNGNNPTIFRLIIGLSVALKEETCQMVRN
jgi:hypothetical protein